MSQAWDNVTYTGRCMLVCDSAAAVYRWCTRHAIPHGDGQPPSPVWAFVQACYGRRLDPQWTKWTTDEARALCQRFGVTGFTGALSATAERC